MIVDIETMAPEAAELYSEARALSVSYGQQAPRVALLGDEFTVMRRMDGLVLARGSDLVDALASAVGRLKMGGGWWV